MCQNCHTDNEPWKIRPAHKRYFPVIRGNFEYGRCPLHAAAIIAIVYATNKAKRKRQNAKISRLRATHVQTLYFSKFSPSSNLVRMDFFRFDNVSSKFFPTLELEVILKTSTLEKEAVDLDDPHSDHFTSNLVRTFHNLI